MKTQEELIEWLSDRYDPMEILELLNLTKADVIDLIYDWDMWDRVAEIYNDEEALHDDSL